MAAWVEFSVLSGDPIIRILGLVVNGDSLLV